MRILVVEDEEAMREALTFLLQAAGHTVATAGDGVTALARVEDFSPEMVLLDLMLPKLNGVEVCRRIRAQHDIPVIIVSARSGDAEKVVGLEAGADDYVTKPYSSAELLARVQAVARGRGSRAEMAAGPIQAGIPPRPRTASERRSRTGTPAS